VAERLHAIFSSAPGPKAKPEPAAPSADVSGVWDAEIEYEAGSARHKLFLAAKGSEITGSHDGWAYQGDLRGSMNGDRVELRSAFRVEGTTLTYTFTGTLAGDTLSGDVSLGEYGKARWRAKRHEPAKRA
jgi:L-seryl-tRNA(Ser) seleniumtransferase